MFEKLSAPLVEGRLAVCNSTAGPHWGQTTVLEN